MELDLMEKDNFSIGNELGRNVIIFGLNMDSSTNLNNKKRRFNSCKKTNTRIS